MGGLRNTEFRAILHHATEDNPCRGPLENSRGPALPKHVDGFFALGGDEDAADAGGHALAEALLAAGHGGFDQIAQFVVGARVRAWLRATNKSVKMSNLLEKSKSNM